LLLLYAQLQNHFAASAAAVVEAQALHGDYAVPVRKYREPAPFFAWDFLADHQPLERVRPAGRGQAEPVAGPARAYGQ